MRWRVENVPLIDEVVETMVKLKVEVLPVEVS